MYILKDRSKQTASQLSKQNNILPEHLVEHSALLNTPINTYTSQFHLVLLDAISVPRCYVMHV